MKRAIDLVVALVTTVILFPVYIAIAIAIFVFDGRPIFFLQTRVGRYGQPFRILKFRTMIDGRVAASGRELTVGRDPRCTRVGWWLRRHKLDELPQLCNVIAGQMSLVGPRPEVPLYVDFWPIASRNKILSMRPGLTDPASIFFRSESELLASSNDPENFYIQEILPRKLRMYEDYVENATLLLDVRILHQTWKAIICEASAPMHDEL